jgi:DNA-binding transcriptional MerR regulator
MAQDSKETEITVTIGRVSGETGLPISTIRYYEKEFGSYLQLPKTPGGHRRFRTEDVEKLKRIHYLIHTQGLSLKDAKTKLVSDRDPVLMRRDLDLLLEVFETLVSENIKLHRAIEDMTARLLALEEQAKKKKFKLF